MKTLQVYGYSDDLIETRGIEGCDEFPARWSSKDPRLAGHMQVKGDGYTISIYAIYNGHWGFAIGPENGDYDKMPPWKIERVWGDPVRYSETLNIEVPDDATLEYLQ